MALLQYIGVALGSAVMLSFVSLIWPKVTVEPRPKQLTQVRNIVIQTPVGKEAARVLGVSDESNIEPASIGELVAQQANMAVTTVQKSAQRAVTSRLITQLAAQFEQLPKDQQQEFQELICEPSQ